MMLALRMYRSLPKCIAARLSGISGSDLAAVTGSASRYFTAVTSMPFVPGHEVVGVLRDDCGDLPKGTRVVLDCVLGCASRGLDPCRGCATEQPDHCDHVTVGLLNPRLQTGFGADTGGGWGTELIAHRSQLHAVPDELDDAVAVLVEPWARALQAAHRAEVSTGDHVVVSGAGTLGLFVALALRTLDSSVTITGIGKHAWQRQLALAFGGQPLFGSALELARQADLRQVVGARYGLHQWRQALDHHQTAGRSGTVKVAFDLTGER